MRRNYIVTIEHTGETPETFDGYFGEYLTRPEGVFISDYGPFAWGGYDGPKVVWVWLRAEDGSFAVDSGDLSELSEDDS